MLGLLKDLFAHQAWADAMFFHAWRKAEVREDPELRVRVGHMMDVQEAFLGVVKGEFNISQGDSAGDFETLKARSIAAHEALGELVSNLDPSGLDRIVQVPWFPDPPCRVPVSEALTQVCLHGQHHRGQNMSRIKALGGTPRNVDYIIWLWKGRPGPRWDL